MANPPYKLRISRKTVDKLGVKLYDKVALVISELVSNAYDADAKVVRVSAPADQYLATRKADGVADRGFTIEVEDNGIGMGPDHLARFYLVVGSDRRADERGATSGGGRPVMGRKGVGKLAPFGICKTIEIISAGGEPRLSKGHDGSPVEEFQVGHVILNYDDIRSDQDQEYDYEPKAGHLDHTYTTKRGTKVILRDFLTRKVPALDQLAEEIAQRFGMTLSANDWSVVLIDNAATPPVTATVSALDIPLMAGTKVSFNGALPTLPRPNLAGYASGAEGGATLAVRAGFEHEGVSYPIVGWVAYAAEPTSGIRSGIRIYCRGKFAAQTTGFDIGSGFTGELQVKSYLVGELHCDWLDDEEDLIHTDRQNIQWSSDIGSQFQAWGQALIREVGRLARRPAQEKAVDLFRETVNITESLQRVFPSADQASVRKRARDVAEALAKKLSPDQAKDPEAAKEVFNLATSFAPHLELSDELQRAADENEHLTVASVASILARAKVAEAMTLGTIASKRLRIIKQFEGLIADTETSEIELQRLVEQAPWLVRPEWTPITMNKSLATVKLALERYLSKVFEESITLSAMGNPTRRPDFVMIGAVGPLQIVEIKKPHHDFNQTDFERFIPYVEAFDTFFAEKVNQKALSEAGVHRYKITLVTDGFKLGKASQLALNALEKDDRYEPISWDVLTGRASHVHADFMQGLSEAGLRIDEE